ncbi:helix-turn-helix domain-containing protein [Enterobacter ludwigii]|uniref:helix-turn-helix domain-containing protein n=1 Tax=Enterobacter ludwigii TaxID=299767 RepID=UPI0018685404|nr:helix-turn-helix transcriptional regulator [Enterobacter ludwigii]
MVNLSINYAPKLRAIRKAEKLTQKLFAELAGVSISAVRGYESGHKLARSEVMERVLMVPQFQKYTLWLLHGSTQNVARQVSLPFDESFES